MPSVLVNPNRDSVTCSSYVKFHCRVNSFMARVENTVAAVAGCAVVVMMILVSVNALLRYFFSAPLSFQFHVTQYYLLVTTTMLSLPWGYRKGGAIQIRLLLDKLPTAIAAPVVRLGLAASAVYLLLLSWQAYLVFEKALLEHEVVMGVVDWPVAWSWVWIPIGCGLLAIRLFVDATARTLSPVGKLRD